MFPAGFDKTVAWRHYVRVDERSSFRRWPPRRCYSCASAAAVRVGMFFA